MSKEVKAFRLVSGEEILGKVVAETDDVYVLEDVRALHAQPGPQGMQIGLIPYMLSNPELKSFTLRRSAVIGVTEPTAELENGYLQQTSGIAIATSV